MVTPNPGANIVAARLFLKAGSCQELPEERGLANLLAAVLTKGTQARSALTLAESVEGMGAGFGTDAIHDYFVVSLKAVGDDFPQLLDLAADVVRNPVFPESEIELERRMVLQIIQSRREQPFTLAFNTLCRVLYPNHAYADSTSGHLDTVAHLQRFHLKAFHHRYFRPDNLIISVAGAVDLDRVRQWVEGCFGDWHVSPIAPRSPMPCPPFPASQWCAQIHPSQQAMIMVGYRVPGVTDPAYVPLKLLSTYLGNGMSSRLFVQLRERLGLAYDVSAFYPTRYHGSALVAYLGTAPDNGAIALKHLYAELQRLSQEPLPLSLLQSLRNKILGQYLLGKQTNEQLAHLLGWYQVLGLGSSFDQRFQDQVATVTADDLWAVAQQYLQTPVVSVLGSADMLETLEPMRWTIADNSRQYRPWDPGLP